MRKTLVALLVLGLTAVSASAQQMRPNFQHGIGVMVGERTGISYKHHFDHRTALALGAAWSVDSKHRFHFQADYLWHDFSKIQVQSGRLPVYYGIGGRFKERDRSKNEFAVRIPIGLDYYFGGAPLDIYGEIAPLVTVFPNTDIDLEAAIGLRFWF